MLPSLDKKPTSLMFMLLNRTHNLA